MATSRYDIRFYPENDLQIRVFINDKLREHQTLQGILRADIPADYANSLVDELTDAMRQAGVEWDKIPEFMPYWLRETEKRYEKEFTDGQN